MVISPGRLVREKIGIKWVVEERVGTDQRGLSNVHAHIFLFSTVDRCRCLSAQKDPQRLTVTHRDEQFAFPYHALSDHTTSIGQPISLLAEKPNANVYDGRIVANASALSDFVERLVDSP